MTQGRSKITRYYNCKLDTWHAGPSLNRPRSSPNMGCAKNGNDVFVIGGYQDADLARNTLEIWNGIKWELIVMPFAVGVNSLISTGRTLYLHGTSVDSSSTNLRKDMYITTWRIDKDNKFNQIRNFQNSNHTWRPLTTGLSLPSSFLTDCSGIDL